MKSIRIEIQDDMKSAVVEMARKSGRPQSDIIRHAIAKYLQYETGEVFEWRLGWGGARERANGASS